MNKIKKALKLIGVYGILALGVAGVLLGTGVAKADINSNYWIQNAPNSLSTNAPGGIATADIHVAHCYIGTGNTTSCASGGGGASLTGNNTFTGQNTFTNANQTNIANLDTTLYADQYSGADMCAKINTTYAALPSAGGIIKLPAGSFNCTTPIVFSVNGKRPLLQGAPGGATILNFTPTSGNAITINVSEGPSTGYGIDSVTFNGPGGTNTTEGLVVGGANGAQNITVTRTTFEHFNIGTETGQNVWSETFDNDYWQSDNQEFLVDVSSNSGENIKVTNSTFSGCGTIPGCVTFSHNGSASANLTNDAFDTAAIMVGTGNNVTMTGGHMENPGDSAISPYDYIVIGNDSGNFTAFTDTGTTFFLDNFSGNGTEFILDGGDLAMYSPIVWKNGTTIMTSFITTVSTFGTAAVHDIKFNGAAVTDIMNATAPTAPSNGTYDNLVSKINSWPAGTNQSSSNVTSFVNKGTAGTVDLNHFWNLGSSATGTNAWLTLAAGTASPDVAPLKINPGVLTGTPVSGFIENDGNHIYYTSNTPTRIQLDGQGTALLSSNNIWTGTNTIQSTSANAFSVGANGSTNPVLNIDDSIASQVDGVSIQGGAVGAGTTVTATSSGANSPITITSIGTGTANLNTTSASSSDNLKIANGTKLSVNASSVAVTDRFSVTDQVATATNSRFQFTGAADTGITSNVEAPSVLFAINQVRQWAGSTGFALQRAFRIEQPTYAFASPTGTITEASTFYIDGQPLAGTNAAITNAYALHVAAGTSLFGGALLNSSGGVGYATGLGAGGTVTQATSKSTGVTLNAYSGTITMNNAALSSATIASFTVTDSDMGANDVVAIQHDSGGTVGVYTVDPSNSTAGSFVVNVRNSGTVPLSEAIVLRFAIIKGSVN